MARVSSVIGRASSGGTVQTAPPAASDRSASQSAYGEFKAGIGDVTRGRVSLLMLNSLILLLVVFYLWTRSQQGGG